MRASDCALAVTVPLHRQDFLADLVARTEFLERFVASQQSRDLDVLWAIYGASAAAAAASTDRARRRGVTVITRAVLADFERCLRQFQVVTLVAHWRTGGDAVEFADGLVPLEDVVAAVPAGFGGVLDLTICHSSRFTDAVRRRCRRALVIARTAPSTLEFLMESYNAALDLMQRQSINYEDAVLGGRQ